MLCRYGITQNQSWRLVSLFSNLIHGTPEAPRKCVWDLLDRVLPTDVAQICMDYYRDHCFTLDVYALLNNASWRLSNPNISKRARRRSTQAEYRWSHYLQKGIDEICITGTKGCSKR